MSWVRAPLAPKSDRSLIIVRHDGIFRGGRRIAMWVQRGRNGRAEFVALMNAPWCGAVGPCPTKSTMVTAIADQIAR